MRMSRIFVGVMCLGLVFGCSMVDVNQYASSSADFSKLNSYDWMDVQVTGDVPESTVDFVQKTVNMQLESKGLKWDTYNPDAYVVMHVGHNREVDVAKYGYQYSPSTMGWVYPIEEGSLVVDIIESQMKEVVWRGVAKGSLNPMDTPSERQQKIVSAISALFAGFPK